MHLGFHNIPYDGVNHTDTNDWREHGFTNSNQLWTMWHFITCKHHTIISDECTIPSHLTQVDIIKTRIKMNYVALHRM